MKWIALVLLALAGLAHADCQYNGQSYPVGTRLGSLTCTPQGWR